MDFANYITASATVAIAGLTFFLWYENRTLRKAGSSPELVAYLSPHPDGHGGIEFVLANVGRGPAFDVTFDLICDEEDFKAHARSLEIDGAAAAPRRDVVRVGRSGGIVRAAGRDGRCGDSSTCRPLSNSRDLLRLGD